MTLRVAGRDCGDCTVCCKVLPADALDFKKQSGTPCTHCEEGRGCRIYLARPSVCRDFVCGWRCLPRLDDSWRPDRSGILIVFETDDSCIPPGYEIRPAIKFLVTGHKRSLEALPFIRYVNGVIYNGAPAFLAVPGPPGTFPVKAFLNDVLKEEVERANGLGIAIKLARIYDTLSRGRFDPVVFASDAPYAAGRTSPPPQRPAPKANYRVERSVGAQPGA